MRGKIKNYHQMRLSSFTGIFPIKGVLNTHGQLADGMLKIKNGCYAFANEMTIVTFLALPGFEN
jgi:hypothetical protein